MHVTNSLQGTHKANAESADAEAAGAPASIGKDGFTDSAMARETKLSAEGNVVFHQPINIAGKIVEVMRSYKSGPDYFIPVQIHRFD